MTEKKLLKGIDVLKLICAFLIVFLHTYNRDGGMLGNWFYRVIASIGVPFFFIVSGFFFARGLRRTNWSFDYLKVYLDRIIKIYVAWTLITLPVSWLCVVRGHGDYSFSLKVIYLFRMIFFSGSCGIYWYVLAMICSCPIIYYFTRKGWEMYLYIVSTLLFIVGVWYNSPYNDNNIVFLFIHAVFGSERNFFNVGLFYMCIGYIFAVNESRLKFKSTFIYSLLIIAIIFRSYEVNLLHINLLQALLAALFFIMALNLAVNISNEKSMILRKLSTTMYLIHYPFILLFDFYLKRGTLIDYPMALCFCFVGYWMMTKFFSHKLQQILLG